MIRKLQLEIPKITTPEEYTFPYWNIKHRVPGQPVDYLSVKYNATYKRVAETMIKIDPLGFQNLTLMGLFATNHRTIGDYLGFQFRQHQFSSPTIKNTIVIERDRSVCKKILEIEDQFMGSTRPVLIQSLMKNLIWTPGRVGRPPCDALNIIKFQNTFRNQVNFIDADLMCNWGRTQEFSYIPEMINMFAAQNCVVHLNAVSHHVRTSSWSTNKKQVEEILNRIFSSIHRKVSSLTIESYVTFSVNKIKTEMTSAVFALNT